MFILHIDSPAYGGDMDAIVPATTIDECWRMILQAIENNENALYCLFGTRTIEIAVEKDHVRFIIENNEALGVFVKFCLEAKVDIIKWSFSEFSRLINGLQWHLVNEKLSDDPFVSFVYYVWKLSPTVEDKYVTMEVDLTDDTCPRRYYCTHNDESYEDDVKSKVSVLMSDLDFEKWVQLHQ